MNNIDIDMHMESATETNRQLIKTFYEAFGRLDAETMSSCYHQDIEFEDPAFGKLKGSRASDMWRMLIASQTKETFSVRHSNIEVAEERGSAFWEAEYIFSRTGRKVLNEIRAEFEFRDGLIIRHTDDFDLHRWARQALGLKGFLLGWTRFFKNKLAMRTNSLLDRYIEKKMIL